MNHPDCSESIEACALHYGADCDDMRNYLLQGQQRALELNNRSPIKFDSSGKLAAEIRAAYSQYGFYVFENVLAAEEIADLEQDLKKMRRQFPVDSKATLNKDGEQALGVGHKALNLLWSKPLGDPLGGTAIANGRHQVKLFEPKAAQDAPAEAVFVLLGSLQFSEACLRAYAHPALLRVAADINGPDFTPFNEALFIKEPGIGAAVSWHQDGDTHWNNPDFEEDIHGFNFMAQVYGSTAVNGVWVVPGTHKLGKLDITKMVADAGSERLPDAVPMICGPGDVVISNRQLVHGSFANTGFEPRVTVNFGFHKRSSVLGIKGAGIHSDAVIYDEKMIAARSEALGYAIDARKQRYPDEEPYDYQPFEQSKSTFSWNESVQSKLKDYNLLDLSI